jgi:hypothetical protein
VIAGGPKWSGNTPLDDAAVDDEARAFDDREENVPEARVTTPITVHALLLLYEKDEDRRGLVRDGGRGARAARGEDRPWLPLDLRPDERGIAREHFGFADGVSQPARSRTGTVIVRAGPTIPRIIGTACRSAKC